MRRIGITGHVRLPDDTAAWVAEALTARLQEVAGPALHGVTCLARGADQLFAQVVLALKGSYDVVLPAEDYQQQMVREGYGEGFTDLLSKAAGVRTMPYPTSSRAAYLAASDDMLDHCDLLLAVWDGRPSQRIGDTAHVVARARQRRIPVTVVWPGPPG